MTSITTRAGKGSPLTHNEVDANFTNLNNDKLDTAGIALGSAASPTLKFTGDPNTGIYSPGADQLAVSTGGTGRLFVDASGNVCLKKEPALPNYSKALTVVATDAAIALRANSLGTYTDQGIFFAVDGVNYSQIYNEGAGQLIFRTGSGLIERARITSTGVGIGTTTPATTLDVNGDVTIADKIIHGGDTNTAIRFPAADTVSIETAGGERARIDSSGRVLIGTPTGVGVSSPSIPLFTVRTVGFSTAFIADRTDSVGGVLSLAKSRSATLGGTTVVQNNDILGQIRFAGADGVDLESYGALISADVDGTPGANDMPGRLVFSTTADGASSPTERLRITSAGNVGIGTTSPTTLLDVNADTVRVRTARTPASASATGATGEICWDANYIYVCTATNTWRRTAISSW